MAAVAAFAVVVEVGDEREQPMIARWKQSCLILAAAGLLAQIPLGAHAASAGPIIFTTPQKGADDFIAAVRAHDRATVRKILGPGSGPLLSSGDPVADAQVRQDFITALAEGEKVVQERNNRAVLLVGKQEWPFPIPLVRHGKGWYFDTKAGALEILDRRIGRNELSTIEVCRAYVDAQREYNSKNREYAQRILSSPGKRDGLYWPAATGEEESPLGPLVANARARGYRAHHEAPTPYYGYYYRVLTAQGPDAQGGSTNYIVNGRMIGGFGLVAFPARYGVSGVMTFIVNQDGTVYQKDLGPKTPHLAIAMERFNPDRSWTVAKTDE